MRPLCYKEEQRCQHIDSELEWTKYLLLWEQRDQNRGHYRSFLVRRLNSWLSKGRLYGQEYTSWTSVLYGDLYSHCLDGRNSRHFLVPSFLYSRSDSAWLRHTSLCCIKKSKGCVCSNLLAYLAFVFVFVCFCWLASRALVPLLEWRFLCPPFFSLSLLWPCFFVWGGSILFFCVT